MNLMQRDVQNVNAKDHQINQAVLAQMDNRHSKVTIAVGVRIKKIVHRLTPVLFHSMMFMLFVVLVLNEWYYK
jgi:hypothetical protein